MSVGPQELDDAAREKRERRIKFLQAEANQSGQTDAWFEPLYADHLRGELTVPWDDGGTNPHLLAWLERECVDGQGKRALEIGCGTGDGARALAERGFQVDAFDLSPSAIQIAKERNSHPSITFGARDMTAPHPDLRGKFDLVVEVYTLQAIQEGPRKILSARLPEFVAPGGTLLVVCRARDPEEEADGPPWPLTETELRAIAPAGGPLTLHSLERFADGENPSKQRFRAVYRG